jgi:hypothetical protein
MSLLSDNVQSVTLAPDKESARTVLPIRLLNEKERTFSFEGTSVIPIDM